MKKSFMSSLFKLLFVLGGLLLFPVITFAAQQGVVPSIGGIRLEFILFALILLGVAVFHDQTFWVAIIGLTVIVAFKFIFDPSYHFAEHFFGENSLIEQLSSKEMRQGEWGIILNLLGLLLGFAVLAKIFEESGVPESLPKFLPSDWKGPFVLLIFVFILSSFLDNIAAALIGGTVALVVFRGKVHIGYIAAIVASSNAGGSGSVVGDTTTTMMWIDGVTPLQVVHAFIPAVVALIFMAWFAARKQNAYQPIVKTDEKAAKILWVNIISVALILLGAIVSNFYYDMPALGVWIAILISAVFMKMPWNEVPGAIKGTIFLLCLVTCASLMPVETLPDASWITAFALGFISAVFDNIPLTKLCLEQGHYDWGVLAYAVGFGGSMIWFGSSAGVAITNKFPEARNVVKWVKEGWYVIVAYILGFAVMMFVIGWHPTSSKSHKEPATECPVKDCPAKIKADALMQNTASSSLE